MGTTLKDARCLVCASPLEPTTTVWCTDCQTPHHKECFAYAGKCAVFGCTCMRYSFEPGGAGATWIEVKDEQGTVVPQGYVVDFSSGRELVSYATALLGVAAGAFVLLGMHDAPTAQDFFQLAVSFLIGATGVFFSFAISDYRVIDAKTRKVWMHKSFLRQVVTAPEVTFDECAQLVSSYADSRKRSQIWRRWSVYLALRDGTAIQLLDTETVSCDQGAADAELAMPPKVKNIVERVCQLMNLRNEERPDWRPRLR